MSGKRVNLLWKMQHFEIAEASRYHEVSVTCKGRPDRNNDEQTFQMFSSEGLQLSGRSLVWIELVRSKLKFPQ